MICQREESALTTPVKLGGSRRSFAVYNKRGMEYLSLNKH